MIRILELYPEHLNLNGDLANAKVLQRQFALRGMSAQTIQYRKGDEVQTDFDFFVLGHGSKAAWADIESDFDQILPTLLSRAEQGVAGLAVSTGFERLASELFNLEANTVERRSCFATVEANGHEILGYLNSDADLPLAVWSDNVLGTLLHGPVLAKNPQLIETFVAAICQRKSIAVSPIENQNEADLLASLVQEIWSLEKPLAGE